jgi:flagellar assembly factor FliW
VTFFLVDPFVFFDGFALDLSPSEAGRLGASDASQMAVFAIVTFPATRDEPATANLQGPIVINVAHRHAAQVIVSEGPWGVRHAFYLRPRPGAN